MNRNPPDNFYDPPDDPPTWPCPTCDGETTHGEADSDGVRGYDNPLPCDECNDADEVGKE